MNIHEVRLLPDPSFGIGMQLVRPHPGLQTFVRNFKLHPLTGRKLPAQKSGKIVVGEELILVNNVNVSSLDSLNDLVPMIKKYSDEKKILCLTFRHQILIAMDNNFEDNNYRAFRA